MLAALLLLGVALVSAQQPQSCSTPNQWEGRLNRFDPSKKFREYAKISYDATNKRVREIEEVQIGEDRDYYDKLYLHSQNREYKLNLKNRTCTSSVISRPFMPFHVPSDAKYLFSGNVGPVNIPEEHVTVNAFAGKLDEGGEFAIVVSSPDCIPIRIEANSTRFGFAATAFFDVTLGIADPMAFIPPKECSP